MPIFKRRMPNEMRPDRHSAFGIRHWICLATFVCVGCSSDSKPTTQPTSMRQRQDAMLANPGDYKIDDVNTDISGGSVGHFDKDAFKRDMDHVFNP